jgi:hypothetical protein
VEPPSRSTRSTLGSRGRALSSRDRPRVGCLRHRYSADPNKALTQISTVPQTSTPAATAHFAVDRLRNLVRRSFLARLCLATGQQPLWPFDTNIPVDACLSDDMTRDLRRRSWREQLAALGASDAAEAVVSAIDPLGPP